MLALVNIAHYISPLHSSTKVKLAFQLPFLFIHDSIFVLHWNINAAGCMWKAFTVWPRRSGDCLSDRVYYNIPDKRNAHVQLVVTLSIVFIQGVIVATCTRNSRWKTHYYEAANTFSLKSSFAEEKHMKNQKRICWHCNITLSQFFSSFTFKKIIKMASII